MKQNKEKRVEEFWKNYKGRLVYEQGQGEVKNGNKM